MKSFILENWRLIFDFLSVICVTIFFFIKKKPIKIVDSVKTTIIAALPNIINRVEEYKDIFDPSRKLDSKEKLQMALNCCYSILVDELGIREEDLCLYRSWLVDAIENILSTPQKKGEIENGEKQKTYS